MVKQQGAIDVRQHSLRALLDDERGDTEAGDELQELSSCRRIELRRGLVEQQQRGLERKCRGQADPLQLTARDLGHGAPAKVGDTDLVESVVCARQDLLGSRCRGSPAQTQLHAQRG